jgi:hypothetical protein
MLTLRQGSFEIDQTLRLPLEWNLPLSGAVTQSFALPFSSGAQFGLFNINLGASGDIALEQQMLTKVGSYGRQLGRLCDAVEALIKKVENKNLTKEDTEALKAFQQMAAAIRHAKTSHDPKKYPAD